MKLQKKLLLSLLGLTSLSVVTPLVLTSCNPNPENNQKTIVNFVDLSNYSCSTIYGEKTFVFESDANSNFKDKSEFEIWNMLGMTNNKNGISKDNFKKLIEGLTFSDVNSDNKLVANDITIAAIENENVNSKVEFINERSIDYLKISFTTNDKAEWQKDNSATIVFKIAVKDWRIDFVDLTNFKSTEIDGEHTYAFKADANVEFKDKTEDEIWKLLGMENNHKGQISKESFDKLIKGLTFENIYDNQTNSNKLTYSSIKSNLINENKVYGSVEFVNNSFIDQLKITFSLVDQYGWNNGYKSTITFVFNIRDWKIDFIDLSTYKSTIIDGKQTYLFKGNANIEFKDKTEDEVWKLLGMSDNHNGQISKESFDKLINGLTFENNDSSNKLLFTDIKTDMILGQEFSSSVSFVQEERADCLKVTFNLNGKYGWNTANNANISFVIKIKDWKVDFIDLTDFKKKEEKDNTSYIFRSVANSTFKDKTESDVWNLLGMTNDKGGQIPKESFSKVVNGLTFDNLFGSRTNTNSSNYTNEVNNKKLSYNDIDFTKINYNKITSKVEFFTEHNSVDYLQITFSLKDNYYWSSQENIDMTFLIVISAKKTIDFIDLNQFTYVTESYRSSGVCAFISDANDNIKGKSFEEVEKILQLKENDTNTGEYISYLNNKEIFDILIKDLTFDNVIDVGGGESSILKPTGKTLSWKDIDTNIVNNPNLEIYISTGPYHALGKRQIVIILRTKYDVDEMKVVDYVWNHSFNQAEIDIFFNF